MVESRKNICLFCSLGCGLIIDVERDEAVNLEYDVDCPANRGKLCAKGNYLLELINHPMRLYVPRKDGKPVKLEQASAEIAEGLRAARDRKAAALVLSGDASCEDVGIALEFAVNCMGNDKVAISFPTGDDAVVSALAATSVGVPAATLDDVQQSVCTIAVGDPFARCPVIAGRVLAARNAARHNSLNVVSRGGNMTSRFASTHLSGSERAGMLELVAAAIEAHGGANADWEKALVKDVNPGANARRLARSFVESDQSVVVLSTSDPVVAQLASALVKAVGDTKRLFTLHDYGNARGITEIFAGNASVEDVLGSANRGEIDIVLILGADLVASYPSLDVGGALSNVKMVVAGAPFPNKTTGLAHLVLPTALWIEADGTFNGDMRRAAVEPPGGALSYGDILKAVAKAMGVELRAQAPKKALVAGQLDQPTAAALADAARVAEAVPGIESTAIRFADGSLTDRVSWARMVENVH